MSAGTPDYAKLQAMGKLPEDKKHLAPGGVANAELEAKLKEAERKFKLAVSFMTADQKRELKEALKAKEPVQPEPPQDEQPKE